MARRSIMRIELSLTAKGQLEKVSGRQGMSQVALMSRLVEWYANEHELIQGEVMGHYPSEIAGEIAGLILNKLK